MTKPVLTVRDLRVSYRGPVGEVPAVNGVDLELNAGELAGIAGESGSGKTTLALAVGQLLPRENLQVLSGSVQFEGRELVGASPVALRAVRGAGIAYIFQEPASAMNPVMTIGAQIAEVLVCHQWLRRHAEAAPCAAAHQMQEEAVAREVAALLARVGIADAALRVRQYPHQLSGGLLQRAMIAMALAGRPRLLIADEPTSALDVTIQAQIVDLLQRLRRELGLAVLLVSHDLPLLFDVADRIGVMYAGRLVETGSASQIRRAPRHPYTQGLIAGLLHEEARHRQRLTAIPGEPPSLASMPGGCPFHPRCGVAEPRCACEEQPVRWVETGHGVRCWKTADG